MRPTITLLVLAALAAIVACADEESSARGSPGPVQARSARSSPEFPLQMWMKANVQPAMLTGDVVSLAAAFERLSTLAPDGYDDWGTLAARGAKAARGGDLEVCRAACKQCHDQYRERYRAQHRSRAVK